MSVIPVASFPSSVWDGVTPQRASRKIEAAPDKDDWAEVLSEVISIETQLYPVAADSVIWVAPHGKATATGSIINPYASIALAYAAVTADDTVICVMPGTYTHAAILAITGTYTGVKIIGVGGSAVTILDHTTADDAAITIIPAIATAFSVTIEGITILQYAAKIGIEIDDTGQSANAITVNLSDVKLTIDTSGDSLDLVHAVAIGVILNLENCVFTGLLDLDIINAADRLNADYCELTGGVTLTAGAVAAIASFRYCVLKDGSDMTSAAEQTINALYCTSTTIGLVATGDLSGGTATEVVLPAS